MVRLFQVLVDGNVNTYVITDLSPASEYEVLLAAVYNDDVESDEVVLVESTGKSGPSGLRVKETSKRKCCCSDVNVNVFSSCLHVFLFTFSENNNHRRHDNHHH